MTKNRRPILWMLLLFAAPLAGAFWLYYGSGWRPAGTTRHGELIEPVRALPPLALDEPGKDPARDPASANPAKSVLTGQWTLLVVGSGESGCDAGCRESLVYARQTWLSLGRENARVRRLLLAGEGCCDAGYLANEHKGLGVAAAAAPGAAAVRAAIPEPREHTVFIVDPLGNLMMRYDVRRDPKGLRDDLKKLLDLSHIG